MQVEPSVMKLEQLTHQEVELLQKFTLPSMRGHPIDFEITGGEVHDCQIASQLIELVGEADYLA